MLPLASSRGGEARWSRTGLGEQERVDASAGKAKKSYFYKQYIEWI